MYLEIGHDEGDAMVEEDAVYSSKSCDLTMIMDEAVFMLQITKSSSALVSKAPELKLSANSHKSFGMAGNIINLTLTICSFIVVQSSRGVRAYHLKVMFTITEHYSFQRFSHSLRSYYTKRHTLFTEYFFKHIFSRIRDINLVHTLGKDRRWHFLRW